MVNLWVYTITRNIKLFSDVPQQYADKVKEEIINKLNNGEFTEQQVEEWLSK